MNDVSNLMSKLKSNVAYRQFADYGAEIGGAGPKSKMALSQSEPRLAVVEAAPIAPSLMQLVESRIDTGRDAAPADADGPPPAAGSLLRRYRAANPPAPASRNLADIFAHLQSKAR